MTKSFGSPWDDYHKWRKWAYEQWYGPESWDKGKGTEKEVPKGFILYTEPFKTYWSDEQSVGIQYLERCIVDLVRADIETADCFVLSPRRLVEKYNLDPVFKEITGITVEG